LPFEKTFKNGSHIYRLFICLLIAPGSAAQDKSCAGFYSAITSGRADSLGKFAARYAGGFQGALLMRISASMETPKERLEVFSKGRAMLDSAITAEPNNPELRFLRLLIQANAPAYLGYSSDIMADSAFISQNMQHMSIPAADAAGKYFTNKASAR
jgi:hypothetical protein